MRIRFPRQPVATASALLLIACAVGLALPLLSTKARLGTVGEWIGGVGACAALLFAAYEITHEAVKRREETLLTRETDARRVWLNPGLEFIPSRYGEGSNYSFRLGNSGSDPIHDVFIEVRVSTTEGTPRHKPVYISELTATQGRGHTHIGRVIAHGRGAGGLDWFVGTIEPSGVVTIEFKTELRTTEDRTIVTWTTVWDEQRWLWINPWAEGVTYGVGDAPSEDDEVDIE